MALLGVAAYLDRSNGSGADRVYIFALRQGRAKAGHAGTGSEISPGQKMSIEIVPAANVVLILEFPTPSTNSQ